MLIYSGTSVSCTVPDPLRKCPVNLDRHALVATNPKRKCCCTTRRSTSTRRTSNRYRFDVKSVCRSFAGRPNAGSTCLATQMNVHTRASIADTVLWIAIISFATKTVIASTIARNARRNFSNGRCWWLIVNASTRLPTLNAISVSDNFNRNED